MVKAAIHQTCRYYWHKLNSKYIIDYNYISSKTYEITYRKIQSNSHCENRKHTAGLWWRKPTSKHGHGLKKKQLDEIKEHLNTINTHPFCIQTHTQQDLTPLIETRNEKVEIMSSELRTLRDSNKTMVSKVG